MVPGTETIHEWVNGGAVNTGKLAAELRHWATWAEGGETLAPEPTTRLRQDIIGLIDSCQAEVERVAELGQTASISRAALIEVLQGLLDTER